MAGQVGGFAGEAAHFGRRDIPDVDRSQITSDRWPEIAGQLFAEAGEVIEVVRRLWDSWEDDAEIRDVQARRFIDRDKLHHVDYKDRFFSVRGPSITPRPPQGQPVVTALAHQQIPYELAAAGADLVFVTPHDDDAAAGILDELRAAQARVGRPGETLYSQADLVVFLDDDGTPGQARRATDPTAPPIIQGRAFVFQDRFETVARWRASAPEKGLSLKGLVLDQFERGPFVGTATQIADRIDDFVQNNGSDGFIIGSHLVPWGLDEFVGQVVPLLQEHGSLRADYTCSTCGTTWACRRCPSLPRDHAGSAA